MAYGQHRYGQVSLADVAVVGMELGLPAGCREGWVYLRNAILPTLAFFGERGRYGYGCDGIR